MKRTSKALAAGVSLMAFATLATFAGVAAGRDYPEQPIKIIVPFPPGASTDVVTRLVAEELRKSFDQTVTVENRAGGTGLIGGSALARSPADGYTIGLGNEATHVTVPLLKKKPPYDSRKDFTPLTIAIRTTMAIAVNPNVLAVQSLPELIAESKRRPGGISFATPGAGSPQQLIGELLQQRSGGVFVHVPYTPEQVAGRTDVPSMPLAQQVEGIREALRSSVATRADVRETAGKEH